MDYKNQYCQNDYTIQVNLQIQSIPVKLSMTFFTELEQKKFEICLEIQKIPNSQSNLEG